MDLGSTAYDAPLVPWSVERVKEVLGTFQGTMSAVGSIGGFGMTSMYHLVADRESYRESMLLMAQTFCLALLIFMPSVWLARTHKQATTYDPARLLI